MKERHILRGISAILSVGVNDIPKTLIRFKKEIEEMEKALSH